MKLRITLGNETALFESHKFYNLFVLRSRILCVVSLPGTLLVREL